MNVIDTCKWFIWWTCLINIILCFVITVAKALILHFSWMVQSLSHFSYGHTDLNDQEYIWRSQLSVHVFGMSVQPLCNTDNGPFSPSQQTCMLRNWRCQFSSSPGLASSVHCTNIPGTEKLRRLKLHHLANRFIWLRSRQPQGKAHMAVRGTELNCIVWKLNWTAQSGNWTELHSLETELNCTVCRIMLQKSISLYCIWFALSVCCALDCELQFTEQLLSWLYQAFSYII